MNHHQRQLQAYEAMAARFRQHSEAAEALYDAIYHEVELALGRPLPPGTTPFGAVKQLAEELRMERRTRMASRRICDDPVAGIGLSSGPPHTVKVIDDDGVID
jgi:hypothetical protein